MKKLKLKLGGKEMLSKEQMKKINGGYDAETMCGSACNELSDYVCCQGGGFAATLGYWTCCDAYDFCVQFMTGWKVTNDPSRCAI
nr:hypothetical protein [uncultured Mucilaginibacter sp.]